MGLSKMVSNFCRTCFSIAQLKDMVKQVLQKLDTILDEPTKSSAEFLDMALQAMEDGNPVRAKDHFMDATRQAVKGYNYGKGETKPELMILSTRLLILAEVSIATFDEEKREFVSGLNSLSKRKQTEMYNII